MSPIFKATLACAVLTAFAGCGRPASYPLTTCVVCEQAFPAAGPVVFVHEGQTVEVCSGEHRDKFLANPPEYLKKIKEVKVL